MSRNAAPWRIWIDTGGTFTDCVALSPDGALHGAKVLSSGRLRGSVIQRVDQRCVRVDVRWSAPRGTYVGFRAHGLGGGEQGLRILDLDPAAALLRVDGCLDAAVEPGTIFDAATGEEAPVVAARLVTGTPPGHPLPALEMRLATTRGTNALLERRGAPTVLFVTRGFRDLLEIGAQDRPDLFALDIVKPRPLHGHVVEVTERLTRDGDVLVPLDAEDLAAQAKAAVDAGWRRAAVALLEAFRNPAHEEAVARILEGAGFEHISLSSAVAPFQRIVPRAQTTVVNAYLSGVLEEYVASIQTSLGSQRLLLMNSAGGLATPAAFRPKDGLLSGPAGGVLGAVDAARRSGAREVITFDMGGTSTDVARASGGGLDYVFEHRVGDATLLAPALAVETVAAGGGSVVSFRGGELRVGPESAGAAPGPACYGRGGPFTLTDANLLLGRLQEDGFEIPVDRSRAEESLGRILDAVAASSGVRPAPDAFLEGVVAIADEAMTDALRRVSLRKGFDPALHALVAFGGAGGQHACGVAERLAVEKIIIPRDAGLLSARGLGAASLERFAARQVLVPLESMEGKLAQLLGEVADEARRSLEQDGAAPGVAVTQRSIVLLRLKGQDACLEVEPSGDATLAEAFRRRHEEVFGFPPPAREVEVESVRVVMGVSGARPPAGLQEALPSATPPVTTRRAVFDGAWQDVPVLRREALAEGSAGRGPALILERHTTTVVGPGWTYGVDPAGAIVLERNAARKADSVLRLAPSASAEVRTELFGGRLRSIVAEMGEMLRRTALSVNIKERLDYSCAILDPGGRLVVSAPHVPVHLGALGVCVRSVARTLPLEPDDVVATNHPEYGGSHLPDVTVISPVHTAGGRLLAYVANRAHHAEIGGVTPGSMPPGARRLVEEGVVLPPFYLVKGGAQRWDELERRLRVGPYPSRRPDENVADIRAAVAANRRGCALLRALAGEHGPEAVLEALAAFLALSARRVEQALDALPPGARTVEEVLDDGSVVRARVEVAHGRAIFDFTGTAGVHPGNLNATPAIVQSVVVYVLRLLVKDPLPLNEGLLEPVEIKIPPGLLDPPFPDDPESAPAVFGGNVETSQRIVGALVRALGLAASSQGTMNNVVFGDESFGYYETVCGGAGAGPGFDGASAVHTHMTNTRITDPEVLEHRYPARVMRFEVRRGSGGAGRWRGGDGVVREIELLAPLSLAVLGQHRSQGPAGLEGGRPGKPALQSILRAGGEVEPLPSTEGVHARPGDRLLLETPGGGGWGEPEAVRGSLTRPEPG